MRSQPRAMLQPAPAATPPHLGDGRLRQPLQGDGHVADVAHVVPLVPALAAVSASPPLRSAPEQNAPPAPVRTTTRSSSSCGDLAEGRQQLVPHRPLMAFFFSGRLSVIVTMPSSDRSTSIVSMRPTILAAVGFNPYTRFRARPVDYVLVVAAVLIALALVLWALPGVTGPRRLGRRARQGRAAPDPAVPGDEALLVPGLQRRHRARRRPPRRRAAGRARHPPPLAPRLLGAPPPPPPRPRPPLTTAY